MKYGIAITALIGTIALSALIIFVLLPIIGISIAATMGLVIIIAVGIFATAVALTLGSAILATLIVFVDYLYGKCIEECFCKLAV